MDVARYQQVKSIFNAAATLSVDKRASYLALACGDDPTLRAEVEVLLANDNQADTFLSNPLLNEGWLAPDTRAFSVGQTIGPYTLEAILGEGGMGTVFLARQTSPVERKVALKLLKRVSPSAEETHRFELERQVLAMLQHSGIAKILDAGQTQDGHPFYVMEYVKGVVLTEFCDEVRLNLQQRIELFIQICDAVDYAHRAGVIHRDLKPSNILVKWENDRPVATIIDFGIAKGLEPALMRAAHSTQHGTILGTPAYMSPEQAKGSMVSTATDVYALGVMLYELLISKLPFEMKSKNLYLILERVIEAEPPSLSGRLTDSTCEEIEYIAERRCIKSKQLFQFLRSDLESVVQKALQKRPEDRYGSVHEMIADLHRFLQHQPISARIRQPWTYRANLWRKRHKAMFGGLVIATSAVLIGIALAFWGFLQAIEFGRKASYEAAKANAINTFLLSMLGISNTYEGGRDIKVAEALDYAVDRLEREHFPDPQVEMGIRLAIAETYAYTNRLQAAQSLLEKSLPRARNLLIDDARETMELEIGLAFIRGIRGDHAYAESVFRRMLPIFENRYGIEDETTLFLYSCLITNLVDQERYQEALQIAKPVYKTMAEAIAVSPEMIRYVEVLDFMTQYSTLLDLNGHSADALSLIDQVIVWKRSYYGEEHNDVLYTQTQRALMAADQKSAALNNLDALLPHLMERFGNDNISAALAAAAFTEHLLRHQRWETGLAFAFDAYQARLEHLGLSHRETFASEQQLCHLYWQTGEIQLLNKLLTDRACLQAPQDLKLWRHLAHFYLRLGSFDSAKTHVRQGLSQYPQDPELIFYNTLIEQTSYAEFQARFPNWDKHAQFKTQFQSYIERHP